MPIKPTYPGVYIQEVPSGVRTIVGVSTSVAVFIGRANMGPLNKPIQCLNYSYFERNFSSVHAGSDLARSVNLFFQNGGTQCYVMRIAKDASQSTVVLKSEGNQPVLKVTAKSYGIVGDTIRVAVTYNGRYPESTFNLEIFRMEKNSKGVKQGAELWQSLSMDKNSPRYAVKFVNQNSELVELTDMKASTVKGYSRSGRPITSEDDTKFRDAWKSLIGKDVSSNRFRIRVDSGPFTEVDLSGIDFTKDLASEIKKIIDEGLPVGTSVDVSFPQGPEDNKGKNTKLLQIASDNGDVLIEPASDLTKDAAIALMLGTSQGGLEVSKYASIRPAPNGIFFDMNKLVEFGGQKQTAFNTITIGETSIPLENKLKTNTIIENPKMYQDGYVSPSPTGNNQGVQEKLRIIADAINDKNIQDRNFKWTAEIWGIRLVLIPGKGSENSKGTISSIGVDNGTNISNYFKVNVRYYSLGPFGEKDFQEPASEPAKDSDPPEINDYEKAFKEIDKQVDIFNLMILPSDDDSKLDWIGLWGRASVFCQQRRAFLLMDAPVWKDTQEAQEGINNLRVGLVKDHTAIFYPRITLNENGLKLNVGASGAIAGLMSRIDSNRGVWKAPAGIEADLRGIVGIEKRLSDQENGELNQRGINSIRIFPNGIVNWGARTMDGDDDFSSEWKYIPVRRTALFIEESLYRGTKWAVFEPNDEPLWSQIRLNIGAFMHSLFRQGAFKGQTPKEAYFVKCDGETTTQDYVNKGIVNIIVGFAPLKPAEFVIIQIQQIAGKLQT